LHDGQGPPRTGNSARCQTARNPSVLLRFTSKNEMDFNEISTDFSMFKSSISPLKMRQKSHPKTSKSRFLDSRSRPIMSTTCQRVIP
jgi:hypothetical protein